MNYYIVSGYDEESYNPAILSHDKEYTEDDFLSFVRGVVEAKWKQLVEANKDGLVTGETLHDEVIAELIKNHGFQQARFPNYGIDTMKYWDDKEFGEYRGLE